MAECKDIDRALANLASAVNGLNSKIGRLEKKISSLESRLNSLNSSINGFQNQIADLRNQISNLRIRIDSLEKEKKPNNSTDRNLEKRINKLETYCSGVEQILNAIIPLVQAVRSFLG